MKHEVEIEAISHKFDKFAIMAGDKWYNTKKEFAEEWPVKPVVGDTISFDDGGKKYLGKMKIVKSGGGSAGAAKGKAAGGSYNIGVEVGHASNLAMRVMQQRLDMDEKFVIGSTDYWKQFINDTEMVHKLMTGLKTKIGAPKAASPVKKVETIPAPPEPKPAPVEVDEDDLGDLF